LFAVFYVASLFGVLDIPEGSDSDAAVQAAFVDDRGQIVLGVYCSRPAASSSFGSWAASTRVCARRRRDAR